MDGASSPRPSGKETPEWLRYSGASSSSGSAESSVRRAASPEMPGPSYRDALRGKAPASVPVASPRRAAPSGFMADARRSHPLPAPQLLRRGRPVPSGPGRAPVVDEDGFTQVVHRRGWRRQAAPPRREARPVPADLVGLCFNCFAPGHVAAACRNPPKCIRCRREGHRARTCKRPRSPPEGAPSGKRPGRVGVTPSCRPPLGTSGHFPPPPPPPPLPAHGARGTSSSSGTPPPSASYTPPGSLAASTPSGSVVVTSGCAASPGREGRALSSSVGRDAPPLPAGAGRGSRPSSPPSPDAPGARHRRPEVEICVIPWSPVIEANEQALGSALVAMVAGTRPEVSSAQVELYLLDHFHLGSEDAEVRRYSPDDFLIVFRRRIDADRVLHAEHPANAAFTLTFRRWRREARAVSTPLLFKVLLELRGVPAHLWEVDIAQRIVGASCLIIQAAPETTSRRDMQVFTVAAWAVDPDLVARNVVLVVPEKEPPFVSGNLFLRPEELMHSSKATLRYRVAVKVREVQDWHQQDSSSDDEGRRGGGGGDEDDDDFDPGFHPGSRSSRPWPRRHRFRPGGAGDAATRWPTARGCDSALGWWGHEANHSGRIATGRGRAGEAAEHWAAAPPRRPGRSRCLRRPKQRRQVWVARSKPRHDEISGAEKLKQKPSGKALQDDSSGERADIRAVAAASVSVDPAGASQDGTSASHPCPSRDKTGGSGPYEKDLFCPLPERWSPPQRWDPMQLEASSIQTPSLIANLVPVGMVFDRILGAFGPAGPRQASGPVLEAVTFSDVRPVQLEGPSREPIPQPSDVLPVSFCLSPVMSPLREQDPTAEAPLLVSPESRRNITMTRGSPPRDGDEPLSALEFADLCSRPLPEPIIIISPPRRKPRKSFQESLLPRRSPRIAMKTRGRVSNPVVAAQNVLMRKLGIITENGEPDADAVQIYSDLCATGLSNDNAEAIDELFPDHIPVDDEFEEDEELQ
ncbi:unnamed protein product [Urochloa decumbens]|uniref:CCHC-type domain-containing protein n=1 Tax=Urochloa decumbens TaxID=240449 RepID=A0ABC8VXB3_9POAL